MGRLDAYVTSEEFADVLEFINYHLRNRRARLAFMPGEQVRKLIHIVSVPLPPPDVEAPQFFETPPTHEVSSVLLDSVEHMRASAEGELDAWSRMARRANVSPERIRDRVSDELAIPKWALTIETDPSFSSDVDLVIRP